MNELVAAATKQDLGDVRDDLRAELASKQDLHREISRLESQMNAGFAEIVRQLARMDERMTQQFDEMKEYIRDVVRASLDPYRDNPERISKLETVVFAPKPVRRRRNAG